MWYISLYTYYLAYTVSPGQVDQKNNKKIIN